MQTKIEKGKTYFIRKINNDFFITEIEIAKIIDPNTDIQIITSADNMGKHPFEKNYILKQPLNADFFIKDCDFNELKKVVGQMYRKLYKTKIKKKGTKYDKSKKKIIKKKTSKKKKA